VLPTKIELELLLEITVLLIAMQAKHSNWCSIQTLKMCFLNKCVLPSWQTKIDTTHECIPANCPGMSGTVPDLLLLSPVPHASCYLPWMSQKIWSPTTQTFSGTATVAIYSVRQLLFVVISAHYYNCDI